MSSLIEPDSQPRGSTSQVPSSDQDWKIFRKEFKEEKRKRKVGRGRSRTDRKKKKNFRKVVWSFLQTLAGCFSPPPQNFPIYESSLVRTSYEDTKQQISARWKGKAPIVAKPSSSDKEGAEIEFDEEEEATGEEEEEDGENEFEEEEETGEEEDEDEEDETSDEEGDK